METVSQHEKNWKNECPFSFTSLIGDYKPIEARMNAGTVKAGRWDKSVVFRKVGYIF